MTVVQTIGQGIFVRGTLSAGAFTLLPDRLLGHLFG